MKKSRYAEEQIVGVLKDSVAEVETAKLLRKHGISQDDIPIATRRSTAPRR
jgi:hypothetical protein